ncbi:MAG: hypothetical protein WCA89_13310, partial [Terracidiphilus sp.]
HSGASRANWLVLQLLFYANSSIAAGLLLLRLLHFQAALHPAARHMTLMAPFWPGMSVNRNPERLWPGHRACANVDFGAKKGGTNGLAVRAGRPVTQTTSSREDASSITGIYTP